MTQHYKGKQREQARQTVRELIPSIGANIRVRFESITVSCVVKDAKNSYGRVRLLVSPLDGAGEQWIELERVCAVDRANPGRCALCGELDHYGVDCPNSTVGVSK